MLAYWKVPSLSPLPGKSKRRLLRPFCASASAIFGSTKPFLWSPNPWHRMAMSCARHSQTGLSEAQGRSLALHMCRHSCLSHACSNTLFQQLLVTSESLMQVYRYRMRMPHQTGGEAPASDPVSTRMPIICSPLAFFMATRFSAITLGLLWADEAAAAAFL